jgi:putative photosynthetic complex assembly protein 2
VTAPSLAAPGARPRVPAAVAAALAGAVVLFWWGTTGVLLALQRSAGTRLLALALAVAAAAAGLALTARAGRAPAGDARGESALAGARAVLAGALLWTCVSAAFYGGWVVGPAVAPPAAAGTLGRAARAVAATAYSALLALALLAAAWRLARPARAGGGRGAASGAARFAPVTLATFWAAHELAKLNVFLGVSNPGAELLPAYLAPLRAYFGPARNSPLLAASVAALLLATAAALGAARRSRAPAGRAGHALLAGVLALAALEHALLGARTPVGWWDAFLGWRAAP